MSKYPTNWVDYRLPAGQEFSVAVCGFSGKVRHLYIGQDPVRRLFINHVIIENGFCLTGDNCLALDCPLNRSEQDHLLRMLDMYEDEPLDSEVAEQWGSASTLECFLKFARQITDRLPEEIKKPQMPLPEEGPKEE